MAPPGLLVRLIAICYEALIVLALTLLYAFCIEASVVALGLGAAPTAELHDATYSQHPIYFIGWLIFIWYYFAYFWRRSGQTVAMQAWRIKLVNSRGDSAPTMVQTLIRFLAATTSMLLFGAGYLLCLARQDKKSLADLISDTELVRLPKHAQ